MTATVSSVEERNLPGADQKNGEYLTFRLGQESYGIDILKVQEIRGFESPTRMVHAPAEVLGVLNLRGVMVPISDLRIRFGMPAPAYDAQTVTIVLSLAAGMAGIVVDSVSDVIALTPGAIRSAPEFEGAVSPRQVTGIATQVSGDTQRLIILLDIEALMAKTNHEKEGVTV